MSRDKTGNRKLKKNEKEDNKLKILIEQMKKSEYKSKFIIYFFTNT